MNRSESRSRWQRLAAGENDADLWVWLQGVAQAVLEADDLPANVRPGELVRAVGLLGKVDDNAALREQLDVLDGFPFAGPDGTHREPERGERMRNLIAAARASGLIDHDVSDPERRKRIERLIAR